MPEIARAMLAGGVAGLADARLGHLRRMKDAGIRADMLLLRSPGLSETAETVRLAEASLNSELEVVASLAQQARALGKVHQVILMVEVGDRREGLMPEDVEEAARQVESLEGVCLLGLGSNIGCLSAARPSTRDTQLLAQIAMHVEEALGRELAVISGGGSIHLPMLEQGRLPARINQLRVGERILLGTDPGGDTSSVYHTHRDAFTLSGETIEVKWKPDGDLHPPGQPACRCRAIVALGKQDLRVEGLVPRMPGLKIVGATSDHLVIDATGGPVRVGDELRFGLDYAALATAMASCYVMKQLAAAPCRAA
jgi:predicted amino acid racemase